MTTTTYFCSSYSKCGTRNKDDGTENEDYDIETHPRITFSMEKQQHVEGSEEASPDQEDIDKRTYEVHFPDGMAKSNPASSTPFTTKLKSDFSVYLTKNKLSEEDIILKRLWTVFYEFGTEKYYHFFYDFNYAMKRSFYNGSGKKVFVNLFNLFDWQSPLALNTFLRKPSTHYNFRIDYNTRKVITPLPGSPIPDLEISDEPQQKRRRSSSTIISSNKSTRNTRNIRYCDGVVSLSNKTDSPLICVEIKSSDERGVILNAAVQVISYAIGIIRENPSIGCLYAMIITPGQWLIGKVDDTSSLIEMDTYQILRPFATRRFFACLGAIEASLCESRKRFQSLNPPN